MYDCMKLIQEQRYLIKCCEQTRHLPWIPVLTLGFCPQLQDISPRIQDFYPQLRDFCPELWTFGNSCPQFWDLCPQLWCMHRRQVFLHVVLFVEGLRTFWTLKRPFVKMHSGHMSAKFAFLSKPYPTNMALMM